MTPNNPDVAAPETPAQEVAGESANAEGRVDAGIDKQPESVTEAAQIGAPPVLPPAPKVETPEEKAAALLLSKDGQKIEAKDFVVCPGYVGVALEVRKDGRVTVGFVDAKNWPGPINTSFAHFKANDVYVIKLKELPKA